VLTAAVEWGLGAGAGVLHPAWAGLAGTAGPGVASRCWGRSEWRCGVGPGLWRPGSGVQPLAGVAAPTDGSRREGPALRER